MEKINIYDPPIVFHKDYVWPDEDAHRECPKCNAEMQLVKNEKTYFGKPWWCPKCQWQFSEEELSS